jgi:hypothetical protein
MPRIRTIKPEFWQNEELALLSEHARLLAIALLNFCDDEGYFLANPALVRANCFPFQEDSKNIPGSLQELSEIGYIEILECSGKAIGRVVKFLSHQRIDKAQKSKLSALFLLCYAAESHGNSSENRYSTTTPGTFQEEREAKTLSLFRPIKKILISKTHGEAGSQSNLPRVEESISGRSRGNSKSWNGSLPKKLSRSLSIQPVARTA